MACVLIGGKEGVRVVGKGVEVMCVRGVDVFGVAVGCVFPSGEYEDGCAGCVGGCEVRAGDCMFHGSAHAFVVVFGVGDVGALPCVWGIAAAG